MKTMLQKIQTLGQKAAHLQAAIQSAPAKIADVRESIKLTAGHLQQARAELHEVATGLHVETDEDFTSALHEITTHSHVFRDAGYDFAGIDMEVSHGQRIIVHLNRMTAVPEPTMRYILTQNHDHVTVASILHSIIRAESLATKYSAPNMEYAELAVHIGAAPAIRLCWREVVSPKAAIAVKPVDVVASGVSQPVALPPTSSFAQSNFFGAAAAAGETEAAQAAAPSHAIAPTQAGHSRYSTGKSLSGDWKKEALERLKSSPGVSKYSR